MITRVGYNIAEATTVTFPAGHQKGDIALIFAFRDGSTTNPTIPTGWTNITNTTDGTLCSVSVGWKIVTSAADTSGTWTNSTVTIIHVYRGVDHFKPFGTFTSNAGTTHPITYGATTGVTKARMDNQWFAAFVGHTSVDTTTLNGAPTGYTNLQYLTGTNSDAASFDTNGITQIGFASNTVAPGGTAAGWVNVQVPIYPAMPMQENYRYARCISAGVISLGEKIK